MAEACSLNNQGPLGQDQDLMQNQFTVKKNDGTTDVIYTLQAPSEFKASYIDTTSSLSAPRKLTVVNTLKAIGQTGSDRHQVLCQHVYLDANNIAQVVSANITLSVPRNAVITDTLVLDCLMAPINYLQQAGVKTALLDGIIY